MKRVSGQSLREFTTARIFQPLGMKQTHFRDDHAEIVKNIAYGYRRSKNSFKMSVTNFDTVGPAGLVTTVEDLALWDENFYHPRVGGPAMIKQMLERGTLSNGEQLNYAFGLSIGTYRGLAIAWHGGAYAGYRSAITRFPEQHFTAVCLCNFAAAVPWDLTERVADVYLAHDMTPAEKPEDTLSGGGAKTVQLSEAQLRSKVGWYVNRDGDHSRRVILKDGRLQIDGEDTKALSENHFRLLNNPIDYQFEVSTPSGTLRLIDTRFGDDKGDKRLVPVAFEAVPEFTPSPGELKDYVGMYRSEEIDAVYEMKIEQNNLVLHPLKNDPDTLSPVTRDFFDWGGWLIRFKRDAKGRVIGFILSTGRANNLRFEKRDRP